MTLSSKKFPKFSIALVNSYFNETPLKCSARDQEDWTISYSVKLKIFNDGTGRFLVFEKLETINLGDDSWDKKCKIHSFHGFDPECFPFSDSMWDSEGNVKQEIVMKSDFDWSRAMKAFEGEYANYKEYVSKRFCDNLNAKIYEFFRNERRENRGKRYTQKQTISHLQQIVEELVTGKKVSRHCYQDESDDGFSSEDSDDY